MMAEPRTCRRARCKLAARAMAALLVPALWSGAVVLDAGEPPDAARVVALMSAAPPADKAVVFTLRLLRAPESGVDEEQLAVVESTGAVVRLVYSAPAHLKNHVVTARRHFIRYRPHTGRTPVVSGTYRQFGHLPLARFASVLLVSPADLFTITRAPDIEVTGRKHNVFVLQENASGTIFERIEVEVDAASGLPLEARAISTEDGVAWTIRYRFDNRLRSASGAIPFLSAIEVVQQSPAASWVLHIERPMLIDSWKVPRDMQ
jgi:hypothetical protein